MTPNYRETQHYIKYLRRKKMNFINIHSTYFFDIPWWSYPAGITLIGGSSIYPQMQKCPIWISRSSPQRFPPENSDL